MSRLTNEELENISHSPLTWIKSMADEILELRKLRDSAGEFDEKAIEKKWLEIWKDEDFIMPGYAAYDSIVKIVKYQHQQSQLAYAALMKDAERLVEALDKSVKQGYGAQGYLEEEDFRGLSDYYASIILQRENDARAALTAFREKYPIK